MEQKQLNDSLIKFVRLNNLDIVKMLVEQGADVNAYNDLALRHAIYYDYLEIVEYLIKQGADISYYKEMRFYTIPLFMTI